MGAPTIEALREALAKGPQALREALEASPKGRLGPQLLREAVMAGKLEELRILIGRSEIDATVGRGQSALLAAAMFEKPECLLALLEAGADARIATDSGHTALMAAAFCGLDLDPQRLIGASDALAVDSRGRDALHIAASRGSARWLEALLPIRAAAGLLERVDEEGRSALAVAAGSGDTRCVGLLLAAGASQAADAEGDSPLIAAASGGFAPIVEMLLADAGRNLGPNKRGDTPLRHAVLGEDPSCLAALAAWVDLEERRSALGHSALSLACQFNRPDAVEALLRAGADPMGRAMKDQALPIEIAARLGSWPCADALAVHLGAADEAALAAAAKAGPGLMPMFEASREREAVARAAGGVGADGVEAPARRAPRSL